jgi:hypothetical protein
MSNPTVSPLPGENFDVLGHSFERLSDTDKTDLIESELAETDAILVSAIVEPFATNWTSIVKKT